MLTFHKQDGRYTARAGILYLLIEFNGEDSYNWYICQDFEDKCEEVAWHEGSAKTYKEARYEILQACKEMANAILEAL